MATNKLKLEVVEGETEGISYSGERHRRRTILLRFGNRSISKRAVELGLILIAFNVLDGLLTYIGVQLYGIRMEGNALLHALMSMYGAYPAIFAAKMFAVCVAVLLTGYAHSRKWIRPLLVVVCVVYMVFAVWPWTFLIARHYAGSSVQGPNHSRWQGKIR